MAFWQVDPANATDPAVVELAAGEARALTLDTARHGDPARRVLRVALTDLDTGETVRLPAPQLADGVIAQLVRDLAAGHDYELWWHWLVSAEERHSRRTIVRGVAGGEGT